MISVLVRKRLDLNGFPVQTFFSQQSLLRLCREVQKIALTHVLKQGSPDMSCVLMITYGEKEKKS